jgi:hypothetical protein
VTRMAGRMVDNRIGKRIGLQMDVSQRVPGVEPRINTAASGRRDGPPHKQAASSESGRTNHRLRSPPSTSIHPHLALDDLSHNNTEATRTEVLRYASSFLTSHKFHITHTTYFHHGISKVGRPPLASRARRANSMASRRIGHSI